MQPPQQGNGHRHANFGIHFSLNNNLRATRERGGWRLLVVAVVVYSLHRLAVYQGLLPISSKGDNAVMARESRLHGVHEWSPQDVADFLADLGKDPEEKKGMKGAAERAILNGIDGNLLLHHVANSPEEYYEMLGLDGKEEGAARGLFAAAVRDLRTLARKHPRDFWEFRSSHREMVYLMEKAILEQPRTLMIWLYLYQQEDALERLFASNDSLFSHVCFWVMLYMLPNVLLMREALGFWDDHRYLVLIICMVAAVNEYLLVRARIQRARQQINGNFIITWLCKALWNDLWAETVSQILAAAMLWYVNASIWRMVPWVLCDLDLYYHMTLLPFSRTYRFLRWFFRGGNEDPPMNHLHFAMNPFVFGWHGEARGGGQGSSLHEGPPRPMHWPPPIDVPVDIFERVVSVPDSFICKITHDIMREPTMVCVSGHTYERAAIVTWHANSNGEDPMTKKPFKMEDLAPNLALRDMIEGWIEEHRSDRSAHAHVE